VIKYLAPDISMESPRPERRAVPARVYETDATFPMSLHHTYCMDERVCKGGV